MIKVSGIRQ